MPAEKASPRRRTIRHRALRQSIIDTCLAMNARGINQGTSGNVSARRPSKDGNGMLITPSGVPYEQLAPADIVEMSPDAEVKGTLKPSSEWRMHLDIYRARPEAMAVVHTHATYATALSTLRISVPAFHYMVAVAGGTDLRCADYATFGTQALSDTMLTALENRSACLLANHGMICFGPTLEKALWLAGEVETLCHQYWAARQIGDPVVLDTAQMAEVLERFKTYGKQSVGDAQPKRAPKKKTVRPGARSR